MYSSFVFCFCALEFYSPLHAKATKVFVNLKKPKSNHLGESLRPFAILTCLDHQIPMFVWNSVYGPVKRTVIDEDREKVVGWS